MGGPVDIRTVRPLCCAVCDNDVWKVYVNPTDSGIVLIRKIRCTNCMNQIKIVEKNEGTGE